jgi:serine/threonine protein kinase
MKQLGFRRLTIELDDEDDVQCDTGVGYSMGDSTFRAEGLSIGRDYLRIEGKTISRGHLSPENLELKGVLGRGAFSVVQRAHWKSCNSSRFVAVKSCRLLEATRNEQHMLLKELRALCTLSHESLVEVHGAFLSGDTVTLVMELMDVGALDTLTRCTGTLGPSLTAAVAYQILDGLSYLHHHRMIHRDLKPSNILLGSKGWVKLCDFGMVALQESSLNTTVLGTRKYMAPERLRAQPYGRSSDIWSFGLIVLECVTGRQPWSDVSSLVELLVTVEETEVKDLIPRTAEKGLKEIILLSMECNPGKKDCLAA